MAEKFAGKYSFVGQENFDAYLKDTGKIPDTKTFFFLCSEYFH